MTALDRIRIRDLTATGIVGINPDERVTPQEVLINTTLWVDTRPAATSDAIEDAVNYRTVAKAIIAHVEAGEPMLLERLAAELADVCLDTDERIQMVEMTVDKPGALSQARSVGVTIIRSREGGRE